jgi:murein DD-endopeptidase MepM/ murein hydrolase activator NlpD
VVAERGRAEGIGRAAQYTWRRLALGVLVGLLGAGCGARKVYHEVRAGETLYRIGVAYHVPYEAIARANHIADPARIHVGEKLLIPGAAAPARVKTAPHLERAAPLAAAASAPAPRDAPQLEWPVPLGTLSSKFGPRSGSPHDGIDIAAPEGSEVHAAADGEVVYSSTLPGYGNVIIVRHSAGYATVYAHNQKHYVGDGQRVRRGQKIAAVGRSGRTTGPNLHFELRKDNIARDPLQYLPGSLRADLDGLAAGGR